MKLPIADRETAGRILAQALQVYAGREDILILALPRGGVPVALEISTLLGAPLDLMLVRKLGAPGQEELAMGALATGGVQVLNREIVAALHVNEEAVRKTSEREYIELERRQKTYRGDRPLPVIENRIVILVDDGIATGATMKAAIKALRQQEPARIVVAVPVAPVDTVEELKHLADEVIAIYTPEPFIAIGRWYSDFSQLSDEEVRSALDKAWRTSG
ncbi:MAG: phosphoribosyltransferase [Desulfobulbaceae bacterium]|nr:phosphoribosyltransferase [Desulfobulbaceae bacterium]